MSSKRRAASLLAAPEYVAATHRSVSEAIVVDRVDALVLAGAKNDGKLKQSSAARYEALIDIQGRPMVAYVLDALRGSHVVDRIVVVGPSDLREEADRVGARLVESDGSMTDNLRYGIDALGTRSKLLVATSDIPLMTSAMVDDFAHRTEGHEADLYYPIVSESVNEQKYPGMKRTYVRLLEDVYTGGNIMLLSPDVVARSHALVDQMVQMRKHPVQLSRMLGIGFLLRFVMHRVSLAEAEERVSRLFDCRGVAIPLPYPEVGIDVDKPSDLELVEAALRRNDRSA